MEDSRFEEFSGPTVDLAWQEVTWAIALIHWDFSDVATAA